MSVEKRGNSYRIQKMFNGKRYSITFDHKPTKQEEIKAFAQVAEPTVYGKKTFKKAAEEYIATKSKILSPSSVREYKRKIGRLSDDFTSIQIKEITQKDVQTEINRISGKNSPKTVRDSHAFISSVLKQNRPDFKLNTTLPQKIKVEKYIPSDNDIRMVIEHARRTNKGLYYVPCVLGSLGLRRSEICALNASDIVDGVAYINKALVQDENKNWIVKTTKTTESTRFVPIPEDVAKIIEEQGYVFNGYPNSISNYLKRACDELGIPHFSLHKMRHYFATKLSAENVDVETIKFLGGWSSDYVFSNIYRHKVDDKIKNAAELITKNFSL